MRVINYLYSGLWDLKREDLGTYPDEATLKAFGLATLKARINKVMKEEEQEEEQKENNNKNDETNTIITELNSLTCDINEEFQNIRTIIKNGWSEVFSKHNEHINSIKSKEKELVVSKILVYEAPPYQKANDDLNYLLLDCAKGPYVTAIKKYSSEKDETPVSTILDINNILFFDLLMIPIPLSSDVRKMWLKNECFLIDDKPLPVYLFEMNLEYLTKVKKIKLIDRPEFAIGTPHLTALPIFTYYSENELGEEKYFSLRETNNLNTRIIHDLKYLVLPLFKACFVNASNNPDGTLLKLAFGEI